MRKNNYKLVNENAYFSYVSRNIVDSLSTWGGSILVSNLIQKTILYNDKLKHVKYGKLKLPIFACFIMDG